jgi:hypothetical protein
VDLEFFRAKSLSLEGAYGLVIFLRQVTLPWGRLWTCDFFLLVCNNCRHKEYRRSVVPPVFPTFQYIADFNNYYKGPRRGMQRARAWPGVQDPAHSGFFSAPKFCI